MKKLLKSRVLVFALAASLLFMTVRCGYLIYPERKDQARGDLDPIVLIMDGGWIVLGVAAGLWNPFGFLAVVGGLAAYGVDIAYNTIYLPAGKAELRRGDKVAFRLKGAAPADAVLEFALSPRDREGEEEQQIALKQKYVPKGTSLEGRIVFDIPEDIEPGKYELVLKVNGKSSGSSQLDIIE